jgi:NAD(P) transhydrogenase subunit alpha
LQAIATARRLGAVVSAFDVRPVVKEQVESLGATFLQMQITEQAEGAGGYAKELAADTQQKLLEFLAGHLQSTDIVITTAQIPGKPAPRLITAAAVAGMKPGSVIVDLAAEGGGNCELTQAGTEVVHHGVRILGPVNLPATMPFHASQMYGRNVATFVQHLVKDGQLNVDLADEITAATCVTHAGSVRLGGGAKS